MSAPPAPVLVARLGRPRGLRGEIYADSEAGAGLVEAAKRVWLRDARGAWLNQEQPLDVDEARPYKGRWVFHFAGYDSIESIEPFAGADVVIPAADRPLLGDGEYYLADLVGCEVLERTSLRRLGVVTGWQEYGGPDLLEVLPEGASPGKVVWIPFAKAICVEIDPAGRRIVVDPPPGLLELNEPSKDES
jgi:16S rRNA processing protein RimM